MGTRITIGGRVVVRPRVAARVDQQARSNGTGGPCPRVPAAGAVWGACLSGFCHGTLWAHVRRYTLPGLPPDTERIVTLCALFAMGLAPQAPITVDFQTTQIRKDPEQQMHATMTSAVSSYKRRLE